MFDRDVKVDQLLGKRRHDVGEAKRIFADDRRAENIVPLALLCAGQHNLPVGTRNLKVQIEGASGLYLVGD